VKTALLFDSFSGIGGQERKVIELSKFLNADIYTSQVNWDTVDVELKTARIYEIGCVFQGKFSKRMEIASRFSRFSVKGYDAYIFCGFHCLSAVQRNKPNIWLTPAAMEYIYDEKEHDFVSNYLPKWQRPFFDLWCSFYRKFDLKYVKLIDCILANSKFTQKHIQQYYSRNCKVVYPGIDTSRFRCKSFDNFYLMACRLVKEKRVDLVISAFKELPEKNLVIVGDGPEFNYLKNFASGYSNIKLTGAILYDELIDYFSRCTATIGMTLSEAFGLTALESMASGKPTIGANSSGYRETILHGKTGILVNPTKVDIKSAVNILTPDFARNMKDDCLSQAKKFDTIVYFKNIQSALKNLSSI
jgi:glycosyltransferase involved in cell wall biosynthesis